MSTASINSTERNSLKRKREINFFDQFNEKEMYTVYFKFDNSFSSISGIFTGFLYIEDNEYVREENSNTQTISNGPLGLWLDDEPILFEDISSIFQ
jgi:hypothetical protein